MIKPYYTSPDGRIVVYHARWEDVHAAGLVLVDEVKLIHADPPYGVKERMRRGAAGRGDRPNRPRVQARDWPAILGDDRPFDPASLLTLRRPTVLWGAYPDAEQNREIALTVLVVVLVAALVFVALS